MSISEWKADIRLKWLGCSCFEMDFGDITIVSDPWITPNKKHELTWEAVEKCDYIIPYLSCSCKQQLRLVVAVEQALPALGIPAVGLCGLSEPDAHFAGHAVIPCIQRNSGEDIIRSGSSLNHGHAA